MEVRCVGGGHEWAWQLVKVVGEIWLRGEGQNIKEMTMETQPTNERRRSKQNKNKEKETKNTKTTKKPQESTLAWTANHCEGFFFYWWCRCLS